MIATKRRKSKSHISKNTGQPSAISISKQTGTPKLLNRIITPRSKRFIVSYGYLILAAYTCFEGFLVLSSEQTLTVPSDAYLNYMKPFVLLLSLGVYTYAIAISANEVRRGRDILKISVQALSTIFLVILNYTEIYKYLGIIDPSDSLIKQPKICFYFSIVTYTTLGYGDYRPSERAQLFAASEAILGYIIFGVFVGVLLQCFDKLKE